MEMISSFREPLKTVDFRRGGKIKPKKKPPYRGDLIADIGYASLTKIAWSSFLAITFITFRNKT